MHTTIQLFCDIINSFQFPIVFCFESFDQFPRSLPQAYHVPRAITFYVPIFVPHTQAIRISSNLVSDMGWTHVLFSVGVRHQFFIGGSYILQVQSLQSNYHSIIYQWFLFISIAL